MYNIKIEYLSGKEEAYKNLEDYSYDNDVSITLNIDTLHRIDIMLRSIEKVTIEEIKTKLP